MDKEIEKDKIKLSISSLTVPSEVSLSKHTLTLFLYLIHGVFTSAQRYKYIV